MSRPDPIDPRSDHGWLIARGEAKLAAGRWAAAHRLFRRATAVDPDSHQAYLSLAVSLQGLRRWHDAREGFDRVIILAPDLARAYVERSRTLRHLGEQRAALADALRATALAPDDAAGWMALGRCLGKLGQSALALRAYRRAMALDPDRPFVKGRVLQQQIAACDWRGLDRLIADIETDIAAGRESARPFAWQAVATSARSLQECARLFARPAAGQPLWRSARARPGERIRIGYLSGELRDHSTGFLRAGLFEHHDRSRFAITIFDNGWDDGGTVQRRIRAAVDRIVPIRALDDAAVGAAIAAAGIDVLVDLNGYNGHNRQGVLALRAAPVQTTFPGYPGTLGAAYMDYMIADAVVVPSDYRQFYDEAIALMPDSYQPNDRAKVIADRRFARSELGLPDAGVVFCCFNNLYKIMPARFDAWSRILRSVPGSVLWLLSGEGPAQANLCAAAAARGVDAARLVFAPRMPLAEHLARHRAADLFLDTAPCNAHTTASDALWAGLPVLTTLGDTFSGRVAASLLHAIRLPDLVAPTPADYEAMAIRLATAPDELRAIRRRLARNRLTTPLFDTARYTTRLERAFMMMHERRLAGSAPGDFTVPAD